MKFPNGILVLLGMMAAAVIPGCGGKEEAPVSITLRKAEAEYQSSNQFVTVSASGEWSATIHFDNEDDNDFTGWAYFDSVGTYTVKGSGDRKDIVLGWTTNGGGEDRICRIVLTCGGQSSTAIFTQKGRASWDSFLPSTLVSDPVPDWMELPESPGDGLYFISHGTGSGHLAQRNYSFCWDPAALVARWVAYPLNAGYLVSGKRSDEWGLDPKIPRRMQPVLFKAFSSYDRFFDRGHQCPSADRLNYELNVQTFYGTNMTPQKNELNAKAWATLEGKVRTWSRSFDTLYVVTGCTLDGSTQRAYDNDGKAVTVPSGYFKALLGFKRSGTVGISPSTGGYTSIGFYFRHENYTDSEASVMQQAMTIRELEALSGLDFFVNLPDKIGHEMASRVETTRDSWWK